MSYSTFGTYPYKKDPRRDGVRYVRRYHRFLRFRVDKISDEAYTARCVGDPLVVGAAEHEDLDQLLEDDPVWDTSPVAAERMVGLVLGQQGLESLEDGLDEVRWERGHGAYSFRSGSVENSPDDGASVPALLTQALPIDGSS